LHYLANAEPLRYAISFENKETATAPAQEVVVTDVLDQYKIDLTSVQFGEIRFGTNVISVPPGNETFSTLVQLQTNLLVQVSCALDPNSGKLTWRFKSLDPVTLQPPEDPLAGFLPPNTTPPMGEGSVIFSVTPRDSIATGTIISNMATIV